MKSGIRYFLPLALAALLLSACHRGPKMIPADKMAEVYADMFLADQWIFDHELRYQADTTAVYDPIFEKYGYDADDFRYSVDKYMNDADRLLHILKDSKYILQCRLKEVDSRRVVFEKQDSIRKAQLLNAVPMSLLEVQGEELDSLVKDFFPIFPVDSIARARGERYYGPFRRQDAGAEKPALPVEKDTVGNASQDTVLHVMGKLKISRDRLVLDKKIGNE